LGGKIRIERGKEGVREGEGECERVGSEAVGWELGG
jgi:hypothetical protein